MQCSVFDGMQDVRKRTGQRFDGAVLVNGSFLLDFGFDEMDRMPKNSTKNLAEGVWNARDGMITLSELLDGAEYDIGHVKSATRKISLRSI